MYEWPFHSASPGKWKQFCDIYSSSRYCPVSLSIYIKVDHTFPVLASETKDENKKTKSQNLRNAITSPMITTKQPFGRLRFTLSSQKLPFPLLLFDHEKDASWKVIALSFKASSIWTLKEDGCKSVLFPRFRICSGQARNLLKRLVDTMAWN